MKNSPSKLGSRKKKIDSGHSGIPFTDSGFGINAASDFHYADYSGKD